MEEIILVSSGYKLYCNWGNETKYGSAAAITQPFGLVQSVNPTEKNNLIKVRTIGGTRDFNNIVAGKFEVTGSIDYYLQGGAFLRQAIGEDTATTTTVDSGPKIHSGASYLHIMGSAASPGMNSFPSFTLEVADSEDTGAYSTTANIKRKFNGCRVNTCKLSGAVDTPISVSVDWQAQGVTISTAAATSVVAQTVDPYVFYQGVVYSTTGTIGAYTAIGTTNRIAEVNSFDLSINNNLEPVWYISGTTNVYQTKRGLKSLNVKGREYDCNLDLHFKNKTMYERFLGAVGATTPQDTLAGTNVVLDFVRTGNAPGGVKAATDDRMRIILNGCKFNDINLTGGPEDIVGQKLSVFVTSAKWEFVDADSNYKL